MCFFLKRERPAISTASHNCTIVGEGTGDNPDYCLAFADAGGDSQKEHVLSSVGGDEGEEELDCCWTANEHSMLPSSLKNLVTVQSNGTM